MLNSTHNLTGLQLGDIDRGARSGGLNKIFQGGRHPEVQPLTLLYTSYDRKSTPFESHFVNITMILPSRTESCLVFFTAIKYTF